MRERERGRRKRKKDIRCKRQIRRPSREKVSPRYAATKGVACSSLALFLPWEEAACRPPFAGGNPPLGIHRRRVNAFTNFTFTAPRFYSAIRGDLYHCAAPPRSKRRNEEDEDRPWLLVVASRVAGAVDVIQLARYAMPGEFAKLFLGSDLSRTRLQSLSSFLCSFFFVTSRIARVNPKCRN